LVAAVGLIAVAVFAAQAGLVHVPRPRRDDAGRLSVTEIATRRRETPAGLDPGPAPTPEAQAPDVGSVTAPDVGAVDPDRIIPFRMQSARFVSKGF
jgi:hypothetical protein